jgi:hypothetical protein
MGAIASTTNGMSGIRMKVGEFGESERGHARVAQQFARLHQIFLANRFDCE